MHDPTAQRKNVLIENKPASSASSSGGSSGSSRSPGIWLRLSHPAPNNVRPGNDLRVQGEAVWQLFRGDWYDASMIYRDWVTRDAKWFPDLGPDGRRDTPAWMKHLAGWVRTNPNKDLAGKVEKTLEFAEFIGLPIGVHVYDWQKAEFDNDYPHYFPPKAGERALQRAVKNLQSNDVYAMPYINSRLWDTHDRGAEDWRFSARAEPAAAKGPAGDIVRARYNSTEPNGEPVIFGVMCPVPELWQQKLVTTASRLVNKYQTKGVYLDQFTSPATDFCYDPSHGHRMGGGNYWRADGHWPIARHIRRRIPDDRILTGEGSGEPYASVMDGMLALTWRKDHMVPAFPAVYGGAVQLFGSSYRNNWKKPRFFAGFRARLAQGLVYGKQPGWWWPDVVDKPALAGFIKRVLGLRHRLAPYFYAGRAHRPPELDVLTTHPTWSTKRGDQQFKAPAVYTGAWKQFDKQRLALLFVNHTGEPVSPSVQLDLADYGFTGRVRVQPVGPEGPVGQAFTSPPKLKREVTFEAQSPRAWLVRPASTSQ